MSLMNDFNNISSELVAWLYFVSILIVGCIVGLFISMFLDRENTYYQGQIDALNGKIKYEKTVNDDGETVWTEIKQSKNKTK